MAETQTTTGLTAITNQTLSEVKVVSTVLREVVLGYADNQRRSTAHTKKRGEVRGGGRKPWRQKGTGRARVGSSRTPLWRGGGIIFGPSNLINHQAKLTPRLKKQALMMALKLKLDKGALFRMEPATFKTIKDVKQALPELFTMRQTLVVLPDATLYRAMRNASNLFPVSVNRVNAAMIAVAHNVVFVGKTFDDLVTRAS